jgi:hypothetical protein
VKQYQHWMIRLAGVGLALAVVAVPTWAGRLHSTKDTGFEIHRIVSQYQGGTSETIAAAETIPTAPIAGETLFFGSANRFPEFGEVLTYRPGQGWRKLDPGSFSFKADVVTTEPGRGAVTTVVFRFNADQVRLIQNAFVQFRVQPQPPGPFGDNIEGLTLRGPVR